jgi:asparagine synthase (glutamine-hydrolysing)
MINSLEVRSPFVDHNLIEYVLSTDYKYINVENPKEIMKDFLSDDFDKSFLFRKKMGFVFDIKGWIYSNIEYIDKVYEEGVLKEYYSTDSIKKLYRFKTRVNALRLWKIYFLEVYFSNLDNLLND